MNNKLFSIMKSTKVNRCWPCSSVSTTHTPGKKLTMAFVYSGIFLASLFGISNSAPSLHPAIWNHDGMKGGSLLELHEYNDDHHQSPSSSSAAASRSESQKSGGGRRRSGQQEEKDSNVFLVHADNIGIEPAYENTVNPFLSHLEQGWKLKPVRHHYMRKKLLQSAGMSPQQQQKMASINSYADELFGPLPMDPNKPHFVESSETGDDTAEENRAFGDEEKDLGDMFHVMFSTDY